MAIYRYAYRLLGCSLVIQTNHHRLGQLLVEELAGYYQTSNVSGPATILFELNVDDHYQPTEPLSGELVTRYQPEDQLLELQLIHGLGRVQVDYRQLQVKAELAPQALDQGSVLLNWLITIPLAEVIKPWGLFFIHAAALAWEGHGLLFAGKSGSGKSTVALALLSQDWQLVTDDETFILKEQEQHQVLGCSARVKVTYPTYQRFAPWLGTGPVFQAKRTFDLAARFPERIRRQVPLRAICLLKPSGHLALMRLHPQEAVPRLLNLAFLPGQPATARATFQFYSNLVLQIPVYQLQFPIEPAAVHQLIHKEVISNLAG